MVAGAGAEHAGRRHQDRRHGAQAAIKGYRVAGKTGTSRTRQWPAATNKRYISLFAGVVPIENPRFAMVGGGQRASVGGYYGGLVSAPVFHNVMDGALRLMDVPPDDIEQWYVDKNAACRHAGGCRG